MRIDEIKKTVTEDMAGLNTLGTSDDTKTLAPMKVSEEVGKLLYDAVKRYEASVKGMRIADNLKDPDERSKHKARTMANYNTLRALVDRIHKIL